MVKKGQIIFKMCLKLIKSSQKLLKIIKRKPRKHVHVVYQSPRKFYANERRLFMSNICYPHTMAEVFLHTSFIVYTNAFGNDIIELSSMAIDLINDVQIWFSIQLRFQNRHGNQNLTKINQLSFVRAKILSVNDLRNPPQQKLWKSLKF